MFDCVLSLFIRLSSAAVLMGWALSACGQLNARGYLMAGIPTLIAVGISVRREGKAKLRGATARRLRNWWKHKRLLPLVYFFTFGLILIGSISYEPNNFDGLSYREPKVLYWLDQQQWHWISSPYEVVNYTLPNYEWLTVPFYLVTRGFHGTVIINWIAFLLVPGLFFSLMRAFGARGRAAFDWMWILPSGYIIAMEAGGIGNDLVGMAALLAALHCATRFAKTGKGGFLFDALLAAGFCTGVKLSNVPLPAFALIILLRNRAGLLTRKAALTAGLILAALVSAIIPVAENAAHTGSILGSTTKLDQIDHPVAGWMGNGLITVATALEPPVFPSAKKVMPAVEHALGNGFISWVQAHYEKFTLKLHELPQEEVGGLGIGITVTGIVMAWLWLRARKAGTAAAPRPQLLRWQRVLWWSWFGFAMLVIASKLGTGLAFSRNVLPWYPLVIAPLVAWFGGAPLGQSRPWQVTAPVMALTVLPTLLLNPARPLIPASLIVKAAQAAQVSPALQERVQTAYDVYAKRADAFGELREGLPPEARVLGLVSDGSEPTASFWRPFGSRRCVYLLTDAQMRAARTNGVEYLVLAESGCQTYFKTDTEHVLATYGAHAVKTAEIRMLIGWPAARYTLAKFDDPPP